VTIPEAIAILLAGAAAGTLNTIVGSGSLITFPVLLALGFPPVVANVSNTIGLVPGGASAVIGYRKELAGQRTRAIRFGVFAALGGLTGATLLLALPPGAFTSVVPFLILLACLLVVVQPRLTRFLARHREARGENAVLISCAVYLTGIYGGYFGAAQGVILISLLAILLPDDLQRLNGLKNVLVMIVNGVAAIIFALVAPVAWSVVVLIGLGSFAGGQLGAIVGRRLSPTFLRGSIVIVGTAVAVRMLVISA
jgi:uncharacterized protein